jgi:hypothetical protein
MTISDGIKSNSVVRWSFIGLITLVYAMPGLAIYIALKHRKSFPVEYWWIYLTALAAAIAIWIFVRSHGLRSELTFRRLLLCAFIPLLLYVALPM